jgi:plasmid replication initiation protein
MKISNQDLIQSYIITQARYDFSVYEKRILYSIIQMFQQLLEGKKLTGKHRADKDLFGDYMIYMPIKSCLKDEEDKNHHQVKAALRALENKKFEYEDDKVWQIIRLVQAPEIIKNEEVMKFRLHYRLVDAFMDFSKGFSKYEFLTAMKFESTYAMRFYELLSGQTKPIMYSIDNLKIMFQVEDKYSKSNDFIRKVIDAAKKELDKKSPYSFEYSAVKQGKKITSIKFYPVFVSENRDPLLERNDLKRQVSPRWELDKMVIDYLRENFMFSDTEIKNNVDLFALAQSKLDLMYELSMLKAKAMKARNTQGYVIGVLKKMVVTNGKSGSSNVSDQAVK